MQMNAMAQMTAYDETRAAEFGDRFVASLNGAATCLMVSIGHRSGLFDSMRASGPGTAADVAARAGLNARYVREWLGAMVTAGIVDLDPESGVYTLPAEHAAMLTRAAEQANLAVFAQYIPLLGSVEDDILACFRNGGGVPYERFGRFHEVMAEDSGQSVLPVIDSHILPLVPGLKERLAAGIDVLDVGCGRGRAIVKMAALYPRSRFMGFDLSPEAVGWGRQEAERQGLINVGFEVRDLSDFDRTAPKNAFDFVTTFDAVHDQAKPMNVLKGINRALKPGGVYLCQDIKGSTHHHHNIGHPIGTLIYTISCMHCMTVSLAQGGEGLGAMWGRETALAYFNDAGFGDVEVHELEHDIQNYYYVCRA
jgi:2-polyprenyl-3-methyl-5-hydroxy-6-metoxy-1,4-benzoquinol methylase